MKYRIAQTLATVTNDSKPYQSFAPDLTEANKQFDHAISISKAGDRVDMFEKQEVLIKSDNIL